MKIGFSADYNGPGGARSWIKHFSEYLINKGHEVSFGIDLSVDVFCSVANFAKPQELEMIKRSKIKILQRNGAILLDYDHPNKLLVDNYNNNIKTINSFADAIVYQSKFCKEVLFRSIYTGNEPDGDIIYNSTNPQIFCAQVEPLERPINKNVILAAAYWGIPHTAHRAIQLFIEIAKRFIDNKDIEFWLLGMAYPEDIEYVKSANLPNIAKQDISKPIDYSLMPNYLKTTDLVMHLKANEGCSNLVIEAMHTKTPLVGLNSGSLPELVGDAALLAECTNDIRYFPTVNIDDFCDNILKTLANKDYYKEKMFERSKLFTENETYEKYYNKLIELTSK